MDESTLVQLLENVQKPDTNVVRQATTTLRNDYYKKPESLPVLVKVLRHHPDQGVRQQAAVAARTLVPKFWSQQIPENLKAEMRQSLLQSTVAEASPLVKHSSARVISVIALVDLPEGKWGELPDLLVQAANSSGDAGVREFGVYTLFTLLETLQASVAKQLPTFLELFSRTVRDPDSSMVRLYTLLALERISEILSTADEDVTDCANAFKQLVPSMLEVLKAVIQDGDDDKVDQAMEVFQTLLIVDHALISDHFRDLVTFFAQLSINKDVDDDYRVKAISFLLSCVRQKRMKVQAMKFGEDLTMAAMEIVTEMKASEDLEDQTTSQSALTLLDILSASLPPSQVAVPLLNALPNYVNNADADRRRAGILSLGYCVEGAPDFFMTQLDTVFPYVLQLLQDPVQGVRQAALRTTTQLADEMAEDIGKFHEKLVPLLINLLTADNTLEMWKPACQAIDAVLVGVEQEDVERYLPSLMEKLINMLQHDDYKLKGAVVGAIGSTSSGAKSAFLPYFAPTMQLLEPYISKKESEDEMDLRSITLDCMGDMAVAVGPSAFHPYVGMTMESAKEGLELGQTRLRETSFIFFATIAKIYGEHFNEFLPWVVEALLKSLDQEEHEFEAETGEFSITSVGAEGTQKAQVSGGAVQIDDDSLEAGEAMSDDEDGFEDDDDWAETTINAVAMEKEVAGEMLGEILSNTGEAFIPYLQKTIETLAAKADHTYDGVRKACISTLWRAYASLWKIAEARGMPKWQPGVPTKVQPPEEVKQLGRVIIPCTLANLQQDDDRVVISTICNNLAETLKLCGPAIFEDNLETILSITGQLVLIMAKKHPSQIDFDEEDEMLELEEAAEYDWLIIDSAMDVILGLAMALGPDMASMWDTENGIFKHLNKYASSQTPLERSTAVGVIADSIKYMGPAVTPHTDKLLKLILRRLGDENPEVKSNAAYAAGGLCFNSSAPEIANEYPVILSKLERLLHNPEGRMIDNAAGCLARMIMARPEIVPLSEVLPALVQVLPLKEDYEENEPIYQMIVQLYHKQNQTVYELTPTLVPVIAAVMSPPEEQLTPETRAQLVELVRFLHSKDAGILQAHPNLVALVQ